MSYTWDDAAPKPDLRVSAAGKVLATARISLLILWLLLLLPPTVLARLIDPLLAGRNRPLTHRLIQAFFAGAMAVLGIPVRREGVPMQGAGVVVANHTSWLDIFAIHARDRVYFVAKDDVAGWPLVGPLTRLGGTVYIRRSRRGSAGQIAELRDRVLTGQKLVIFPEGTSSDGQRVLPFKPTLFAAFADPALRDITRVQALSVVHKAPADADPRFYGWWGEMDLGPHLFKVASRLRQGEIRLIYHAPVAVADFADRKALAAHCEGLVRAGFETGPGA